MSHSDHELNQLFTDTTLLREILRVLERLECRLFPPPTPTGITFKETSMLPPVAGNTLIYTGTLTPSGSAFTPATKFTVVSSDPNAAATVDATGLIVTIVLDGLFVDNPESPLNVVYTATDSTVTPALTLTATITPTAPVSFPTGITFVQTT